VWLIAHHAALADLAAGDEVRRVGQVCTLAAEFNATTAALTLTFPAGCDYAKQRVPIGEINAKLGAIEAESKCAKQETLRFDAIRSETDRMLEKLQKQHPTLNVVSSSTVSNSISDSTATASVTVSATASSTELKPESVRRKGNVSGKTAIEANSTNNGHLVPLQQTSGIADTIWESGNKEVGGRTAHSHCCFSVCNVEHTVSRWYFRHCANKINTDFPNTFTAE